MVVGGGREEIELDEFTVSTVPFEHDLCGTLSYSASFDGEAELKYLTYSETDHRVSLQSYDFRLLDSWELLELSVEAELSEYA